MQARAQHNQEVAQRAQIALEREHRRKTEEFAADLLQRRWSAEALEEQGKAEREKAAREAGSSKYGPKLHSRRQLLHTSRSCAEEDA